MSRKDVRGLGRPGAGTTREHPSGASSTTYERVSIMVECDPAGYQVTQWATSLTVAPSSVTSADGCVLRSFRHFDCTGLPNHDHLDLPGVLELILDLACDLVRQQRRSLVVDLRRLDDHADLAARL